MRTAALLALLSSAAILAACGGETPTGGDTGEGAAETAGAGTEAGALVRPEAPDGADAVFRGPRLVRTLRVPDNMAMDPAGEFVRLFGGASANEASTSGVTGGASLELPSRIEQAVSGGVVRITVSARAVDTLEDRRFAVVYSTREVGNSDWRRFSLTGDFQLHSFEYDVPPMENGRGDYVGILPDISGAGQPIEIDFVAVEIVRDGSAATE